MARADTPEVSADVADRKAGQFAQDRFRARRRAWRRRIWWVFPLVVLVMAAIEIGLGLALARDHLELFVGTAIGAAAAMVIILVDSPPHHIERWRKGADGEKATARALRPLTRDGWTLLNDIDRGRGNIDHVLVGPPGVFLLETKNLNGKLSVKRGVLTVRWLEDPDDGYASPFVARRAHGAAASLAESLQQVGGQRVWVQPVVVLWGDFEQASIESDGVAWVRGNQIARTLAARPTKLRDAQITAVTAALRAVVASGPGR